MFFKMNSVFRFVTHAASFIIDCVHSSNIRLLLSVLYFLFFYLEMNDQKMISQYYFSSMLSNTHHDWVSHKSQRIARWRKYMRELFFSFSVRWYVIHLVSRNCGRLWRSCCHIDYTACDTIIVTMIMTQNLFAIHP
jgi:hypothetical protein